jgi:VanZ family protein
MAAIFYVSSVPDPAIPVGTDKPLHWLAYLGLAVLVVRAVARGLPERIDVRTVAIATLITAGYAVTDEVHQMFVPGRSAEMYDLLADVAGAIAGTVACWAWGVKAQSTSHKAQ